VNALARDLEATCPGPGEVVVWALGQSGFALRGADRLVLVDPWLSPWLESLSRENPNPVVRPAPSPIGPEDVHGVDLVCITHEHPDHLDVPTAAAIAARVPAARFVAPYPTRHILRACGVSPDRILGARAEVVLDVGDVRVTPVPAAHDLDPVGGYRFWLDAHGEHRALGYLVEIDGRRIFHAGDTVWWPGLEDELRRLHPDLAILPINGRDRLREGRGIVGNLTATEAAALIAETRIAAAIPCHYDGVAGNTAEPADFARELATRAPHATAHVLRPGERVSIAR
jgi:L-ascorbate metabolism protein UlaG (beta-lactamase superfamily)